MKWIHVKTQNIDLLLFQKEQKSTIFYCKISHQFLVITFWHNKSFLILIYSKQLGHLKYTRKVYENIGFSQIPAWLIKMFRKRVLRMKMCIRMKIKDKLCIILSDSDIFCACIYKVHWTSLQYILMTFLLYTFAVHLIILNQNNSRGPLHIRRNALYFSYPSMACVAKIFWDASRPIPLWNHGCVLCILACVSVTKFLTLPDKHFLLK